MNDKELLAYAAKAAGIRLEWDGPPDQWTPMYYQGKTYRSFEPLTDDGDALRLACDLGLRVFPIARTQSGAACSAVGAVTGERLSEVADVSLDTYAATRRAIVRAAAEIGKGMA